MENEKAFANKTKSIYNLETDKIVREWENSQLCILNYRETRIMGR